MDLHIFKPRKRLGLFGPEGGRADHLVVTDVDSGLKDISDTALDQLTHLLYLGPGLRGNGWLLEQERQMREELDHCLLRPKGLIDRLAIGMGKHRAPFTPSLANLCPTHKPLDPRVVRKLMVLVANECTVQVDRFRSARARPSVDVPPPVRCWLERMDSATALWLERAQFEDLFQREAPCTGGPTSERRRCEACIMAVVGGCPQMVMDLRAGLVARRAYAAEKTGTARDPRLLRAVEAWARRHGSTNQHRITAQSETLVGPIVQLRKTARADLKRRRREKYRKRGRPPPSPRRSRRTRTELTREGLPLPRRRALARALVAGNESRSTFLSTAACASEERLALVGRRRTDHGVALREGETGGVDARAWLEGISELESLEKDEEVKEADKEEDNEEEARDSWEDDYVAFREGRVSPAPGEVSDFTSAASPGTTPRTVSELSSRPGRVPQTLDELAGSRPDASMPQSVSATSSWDDDVDDDASLRPEGTPPRRTGGPASTYTLDSYYFEVAGRGGSVPDLPPKPGSTDLHRSPGDETDSDSNSDAESATTSEGVARRPFGAPLGDHGSKRGGLTAEALRRLQEEEGDDEDAGFFVNEDSLAMLEGGAGTSVGRSSGGWPVLYREQE